MNYKAVSYSLIGLDDILDPANPFRRVTLLPEWADPTESLMHQHHHRKLLIHAIVVASDRTLANGFWYVHYDAKLQDPNCLVMTTAQILILLEQGHTVQVISGPFKTEKEALYDMELRWEVWDNEW
jgi:hypothetical protein